MEPRKRGLHVSHLYGPYLAGQPDIREFFCSLQCSRSQASGRSTRQPCRMEYCIHTLANVSSLPPRERSCLSENRGSHAPFQIPARHEKGSKEEHCLPMSLSRDSFHGGIVLSVESLDRLYQDACRSTVIIMTIVLHAPESITLRNTVQSPASQGGI